MQGTPGSSVASKSIPPRVTPGPSLATDRLLESLSRSPPVDLLSPVPPGSHRQAASLRLATRAPPARTSEAPSTPSGGGRRKGNAAARPPDFTFVGAIHAAARNPVARPTQLGCANGPDLDPFPGRRASLGAGSAAGFGSAVSVGTGVSPLLVAGEGAPSPPAGAPETPATPTSQLSARGAGGRVRPGPPSHADKENAGAKRLARSEGGARKAARGAAGERPRASPVRERAPTPERPPPGPPAPPDEVAVLRTANARLAAQLSDTLDMVGSLCGALAALHREGRRALGEAGPQPRPPPGRP